jgi:lipopolysaccharide transport system permease protein
MTDVIRITPKGNQAGYWRQCWQQRELLFYLARRDLVIRYRQTMAGLAWLLFRPAAQVLTFYFIFRQVAGLPDDGLPYPLMVMSGLICWSFYQAVVSQSMGSLVNNTNLITKVHLPRIMLPVGTIAPNMIDLMINLAAYGVLAVIYQEIPSWRLIFLPIPLIMASGIALGIGLWASAASIKYRDLRSLIPFMLHLQFFLTPVTYSSSIIQSRLPEWGQSLYYANPMAACLDLIRWCLWPAGYAPQQDATLLIISLTMGLFLLITGQWYFRYQERTFADVI